MSTLLLTGERTNYSTVLKLEARRKKKKKSRLERTETGKRYSVRPSSPEFIFIALKVFY